MVRIAIRVAAVAGAIALIGGLVLLFLYLRWRTQMEKRIVYSVPGMESVPARKDLSYKAADQTLKADLYLPASTAGSTPSVVIFIHGGVPAGVSPKDWGIYISWGQLMAASGIAAVAFNHRLRWSNGFDAQSLAAATEDVSDLISFVRENAPSFGIDANRICLMAFSAGGPLLASTIARPPASVRCIVGFYPYLGAPLATPDGSSFSSLDAMRDAAGKMPPMFIAKAGRDRPLINESIDAFVTQAKTRHADVQLMEHREGIHGFDAFNDDDTSRDIIAKAVSFIKEHLSR